MRDFDPNFERFQRQNLPYSNETVVEKLVRYEEYLTINEPSVPEDTTPPD